MSASGSNLIFDKSTVFALSTPVGGAIAVIRASGPLSRRVLSEVFTGRIEERFLSHGRIDDGGQTLDDCMAVYFAAPRSYTGEDMFELYLHGSYAVVTAVSRLLESRGLSPAAPGEFTKRAFLNGKLDLVQADAVMDLINAETRRSANAAVEQLEGGLSGRIAAIEEQLIDLASGLGAAMDYPDEMEDETLSSADEKLPPVIAELEALIENGKHSRIVRDGAKLVILGRPNAGKSSLLNAFLNEERAIVTDIAGTTRDTLVEKLSIGGLPVRLTDTAGLRESADSVEAIGMDRAKREARSAECVIVVIDGSQGTVSPDDRAVIEAAGDTPALFAVNKADLSPGNAAAVLEALIKEYPGIPGAVISCKTRSGFDALEKLILSALGAAEDAAIVTNERHIGLLEKAREELSAAVGLGSTELISELIASALFSLSLITGREFSEELLDRIFSRFCVGK